MIWFLVRCCMPRRRYYRRTCRAQRSAPTDWGSLGAALVFLGFLLTPIGLFGVGIEVAALVGGHTPPGTWSALGIWTVILVAGLWPVLRWACKPEYDYLAEPTPPDAHSQAYWSNRR